MTTNTTPDVTHDELAEIVADLHHAATTAETITTTPAPEGTAYRLMLSSGSYGAPDPLILGTDLPIRIGSEVNALVRLRITGRSEREPLGSYDTHTVTTDAKVVEFVEVDGTVVTPPTTPVKSPESPFVRPSTRRIDMVFAFAAGVFLTLTVLGLLAR